MIIDNFHGEYRWLSNFWPVKVVLDGRTYPSVEAAYQAAKTVSPQERKPFEKMNPFEAKKAGRRITLRRDWDQVKLGVMRSLLEQKFSPGGELHKMLLSTKPHTLIEGNTWNDTFWGVCRGRGNNHLGKLLMEIRDRN